MANILIASYGSRGDIMPLTEIGCRLRTAGHHVSMTTNVDLVDELDVLGLNPRPVQFTLDEESDPTTDDPMKLAMQMVKPKGMRQLGHNLLSAIHDAPADLVLMTPFAELAGHPFAEARDIPSIGLRLQPLSATGAFPPSLLGSWRAGRITNRTAGRSAARWIDRLYGGAISSFRAELGLPRRSAHQLRRRRTAANWPILHGFSPTVVPRPTDWRDGLDVVGYWWPSTDPQWTPPAELVSFLQAGPPPVYVGFGSLMLPPDQASSLTELIRHALQQAGVRGVVQSGGTELSITNDSVWAIGPAPHDWLFPQMSAVVHSCGAGTTAAALRAGIPTVAVPSPGGDQPFWARRLADLGASSATIPRPKLTATGLADAINAAVTDATYQENARNVAAAIATDDGAGRVVDAITRTLNSINTA